MDKLTCTGSLVKVYRTSVEFPLAKKMLFSMFCGKIIAAPAVTNEKIIKNNFIKTNR